MIAKSPIQSKLDEKILAALTQLDHLQTDSEEYGAVLDRIAKLHKLKSEETQNEIKIEEIRLKFESDSKLKLPNSETMLVVGANLFGIIWLTRYEREHPISSKALGFVMRPNR